jgi:hypothetical protein
MPTRDLHSIVSKVIGDIDFQPNGKYTEHEIHEMRERVRELTWLTQELADDVKVLYENYNKGKGDKYISDITGSTIYKLKEL